MEITFRKITHALIYYLLPLVLLLISIFSSDRGLFPQLGNFALYALIAVMFIKPLYILLPWKFLRKIGTYRRELGLLSFWLFLFHAVGLIYTRSMFSVSSYLGFGNFLFWGAVAGICMVLTGVTSNSFSVRLLKRNWKRVHYLAYLAFLGTLVHVGLMRNGREFTTYAVIAGLYIVLKAAEFWKMKRKKNSESS